MKSRLEAQIGEVGDLIEVKTVTSPFYFNMVYEGVIDGTHAFANHLPYTETIVSWRAKSEEIQVDYEGKPKRLSLAVKTHAKYEGEDYERAKELLTAGGLWK